MPKLSLHTERNSCKNHHKKISITELPGGMTATIKPTEQPDSSLKFMKRNVSEKLIKNPITPATAAAINVRKSLDKLNLEHQDYSQSRLRESQTTPVLRSTTKGSSTGTRRNTKITFQSGSDKPIDMMQVYKDFLTKAIKDTEDAGHNTSKMISKTDRQSQKWDPVLQTIGEDKSKFIPTLKD